ncbi:MAG: cytosine permease [Actinomycetota bacterium]
MRRDGWLRRLGPWAGIGTSPAALMLGGGVAEGIEGAALPAALITGAVVLGALAAAQGILGQRTGMTLVQLTARALGGEASRRTASVAMLAMMVGWFALNVSVAGTALGRLLDVPDRAGMALMAAVTVAVVWRGVDALSWAALAAGAATAALAAYGLHEVLGARDVSATGDGVAADPVGFLQGVALVVGYGAAFALRTPDFTRDLARARHVVWCALTGMVAPVAAFAMVGAMLQLTTGTWDLADVLRELGSPTAAYLFVAVGFSGSVMTNLYSGALSLSDAAPRAGHRAGLAAVCLLGTALAALHFSQWMLPYLTVMALTAPALIGICVLDALRGHTARPGRHAPGLLGWAAGVAAGLALHLGGSSLALPASLAVAGIVYTLSVTRSGASAENGMSDLEAQ